VERVLRVGTARKFGYNSLAFYRALFFQNNIFRGKTIYFVKVLLPFGVSVM